MVDTAQWVFENAIAVYEKHREQLEAITRAMLADMEDAYQDASVPDVIWTDENTYQESGAWILGVNHIAGLVQGAIELDMTLFRKMKVEGNDER